jgi:hypothetical protein
MGFTKLDDGLIFSSILAEDDAVFKVWVLILSRTDGDGVARISPAFLASVTRKADDEVERCLRVLESPDARSRSLNDDGRRIVRVDGGYKVLNYLKYRQRADQEDVRAYERERKARQRESRSPVPEVSRTEAGRSASASSSPSASGVVAAVEGVQGEAADQRPDHERVRGSNFREAMALETKILRAVDQISKRTGKPAWEVCRQVTSYKRPNGEMTAGVEDPARLGSVLARQKALADAEWWLGELDRTANGSR